VNTYIITHKLRDGVTQDMAVASAKRLIASLPENVNWVMSWYLPNENIVLCQWEGPSVEVIGAALVEAEVSEILPITEAREAIVLHPDWYAQAE
jgi:hypothetical protein